MEIEIDENSKIKAGSEHNVILIGDEMYSWGWNEHGNLGIGNNENTNTMTRV